MVADSVHPLPLPMEYVREPASVTPPRSTGAAAAPYLPAACAALVALALYAVSLGGTYIYDDVGILKVDDRLTHPAQWGRYWHESYNLGIDNLYRPLVSMTCAIQWWLHG